MSAQDFSSITATFYDCPIAEQLFDNISNSILSFWESYKYERPGDDFTLTRTPYSRKLYYQFLENGKETSVTVTYDSLKFYLEVDGPSSLPYQFLAVGIHHTLEQTTEFHRLADFLQTGEVTVTYKAGLLKENPFTDFLLEIE